MAKFLILPIFIIANFLIVFFVRTRTSVVIGLTISHLLAALIFVTFIDDYFVFREMILALAVYSMSILFLVSNYNVSFLSDDEAIKIRQTPIVIIALICGFILLIWVFASVFFISKNIPAMANIVNLEKQKIAREVVKNPMVLPSHGAHVAVEKFYLGRKFQDVWSGKKVSDLEKNNKKRQKIKEKMDGNILFSRSSQIILIIVALVVGLLTLVSKKR